jgi:hypothetical protein
MRQLARTPGKRLACLLGTGVLLAGGIGATSVLAAGPADAVACGTAIAAGATCTMTGTLTLTAGALNLTSPTALAWSETLNGLDQTLVDPTAAQQAFLAVDATGSGAGWHITVSATTFTSTTPTLANAGTFSVNGSTTSIAAATAPTSACSASSTCVLPTNTTTYPVAITTAPTTPTAFTIFDTSAATGLGSIVIGSPGANVVGWWLNVPGSTKFGTGAYTSTITVGIISAP